MAVGLLRREGPLLEGAAAPVVTQEQHPQVTPPLGGVGDLDAVGMRAGVVLQTNGGAILATDIDGPVRSTATHGRQRLAAIRGDVDVEVLSGSLELDSIVLVARSISGGRVNVVGLRLPEEEEKSAPVTRIGSLKRKLADVWSSVAGI